MTDRPLPAPAPRGRARALATAAIAAAGAWALARLAVSVARDVARYRRDAARLREVWATVAGARRHARVATFGARDGAWRGAAHEATPLVLVHGLGVSSAYWVPLAARLAERRAVYVLDLRAEDEEPVDEIGDLAEIVVAWLDALGVRRATLVANSLGCQTAAEVAARWPGRVASLVLVGPTVDPTARGFWRQAARLAASAPFEPPALDAIVVGDYLRLGPRAFAGEVRAMLRHRADWALARVEAPTLVIRGAHDRIVPRRWAAEAARLARGRWIEVPDAGHAVHFDEPDAVAAVIERFLAGAGSAGSARRRA